MHVHWLMWLAIVLLSTYILPFPKVRKRPNPAFSRHFLTRPKFPSIPLNSIPGARALHPQRDASPPNPTSWSRKGVHLLGEDGEFEVNVLSSQALVNGGEGVELVFEGCSVLGIQETRLTGSRDEN